MKVTFGKLDEVEYPDFIKGILDEILQYQKSEKYDEIYICCPHMIYSDEFEPSEKSDKRIDVYIFSTPSSIGTCSQISFPILQIDSTNFSLNSGQRDTLLPLDIPREYLKFLNAEVDDKPYMLIRDNKVWILTDIVHQVGDQSRANVIEKVFQQITDHFGLKVDLEEKAKILRKKLLDIVISRAKNRHITLKENLHTYEANVRTRQQQLQRALRDFLNQKHIMESLKILTKKEAKVLVSNLLELPFVKDISVDYEGNIRVLTNNIILGTFDYGEWDIRLHDNYAIMYSGIEEYHPYEFDDREERGEFCMGGFEESYISAMLECDYGKALTVLKMLLTNYSRSTTIHDLEDFLQAIMGGSRFEKAIKELCKKGGMKRKNFTSISSIMGNEITLVGEDPDSYETLIKVVKIE